MQFDLGVTIDCPIGHVFVYATDLARVPEWAGPPLEREKLTEGPIGVGTRYRAVDKMPGRKVEFIEEVTVYQPNDRFVMTMGEPFNAEVDTAFRSVNGGTRLDFSVDMSPTGLMGVLGPLLARPMKKMFQKDLDNLKAILEATA